MPNYKLTVHCFEKGISKGNPDYKVSGLYALDSISKACKKGQNELCNAIISRIESRLGGIFENLHSMPKDNVTKVRKVVSNWRKISLFPDKLLSLLESKFPSDVPHLGDLLSNTTNTTTTVNILQDPASFLESISTANNNNSNDDTKVNVNSAIFAFNYDDDSDNESVKVKSLTDVHVEKEPTENAAIIALKAFANQMVDNSPIVHIDNRKKSVESAVKYYGDLLGDNDGILQDVLDEE